jgi:hypothetical protein
VGAVLLVTTRFQAAPGIIGSERIRLALWAGAALFAYWVLSKGAELRLAVRLSRKGLEFSYASRPAMLRFDEIETMRFDPPFAARRSWIAAVVLLDQRGSAWRLPVELEAGDRLIDSLLHRSGREDLATWAEVLQIGRRMRRGHWHTLGVYVAAAALLLAATWFHLR